MRFVVFDLEATCDDIAGWDNETLQIGAVRGSDRAEFNHFIKPVRTPITPFCIGLTGITEEHVAKAQNFPDVYTAFIRWAREGMCTDEQLVLCSWGFYDRKQLEKDLQLWGLEDKVVNSNTTHISIKHQYSIITGSKLVGVGKALRREGMVFDGRPHDGMDDARNIFKIFLKYYDRWAIP